MKKRSVETSTTPSVHSYDAIRSELRQKGFIQVPKAAEVWGIRRGEAIEALSLLVSEGQLLCISVNNPLLAKYFSTSPETSTGKKLQDLLDEEEKNTILKHLGTKPTSLSSLSQLVFGKQTKGEAFLQSFFEFYLTKGLVEKTKSGQYQLSPFGGKAGTDHLAVMTLEAMEAEIFVSAKSNARQIKTLQDVSVIMKKNRKRIAIEPFKPFGDRTPDSVKIGFMANPSFGSQDTDVEFVIKFFEFCKQNKVSYDIMLVTGVVQGTFFAEGVNKRLTLAEGLTHAGEQFAAAEAFLQEVETIASHTYIGLSGDEVAIAKSYARLQQLSQGKWWNYWMERRNIKAEKERQLFIIEFFKKFRFQLEVVSPYQLLVGRPLLEPDEVFEKIGVRKHEYEMLAQMTFARKQGIPYPPDYEKVVDIEAMTGKKRNRTVSPNNVWIDLGNGQTLLYANRLGAYSETTMKINPIHNPKKLLDSLALLDKPLPRVVAINGEDMLWVCDINGRQSNGQSAPLMIQVPGLQDTTDAALGKRVRFHDRVQNSKPHKVVSFRSDPSTAAVLSVELLKNGITRFHLWNNRIAQVAEANRGKPEQVVRMASLNDTQFGSGTAAPEALLYYLDYAFYDRGCKILLGNGDITHGVIYPTHAQENQGRRLVTVYEQQEFAKNLLWPMLQEAVMLGLVDVIMVPGNHEYNNMGNKFVGAEHGAFITDMFKDLKRGFELAGKRTQLRRVEYVTRLRLPEDRSHNPQGDAIHAPMAMFSVLGYNVVAAHMPQKKGTGQKNGGSSPIAQQKNLFKGLAYTLSQAHLGSFAHFHSFWLGETGGVFLMQTPAFAVGSDFELGMGLQASVAGTITEFSTHRGITVDLVPYWPFLANYQMKSPFYSKIQKEGGLRLPGPGTHEYKVDRRSAFVEHCTDLAFSHKVAWS